MDRTEIAKEIYRIMNIFGMTGVRVAEIMGITTDTFNSKKNENNERHWFNQKNLDDLKNYIKKEAEKI